MTPENLAKLDQHFRGELIIKPPEGYTLQDLKVYQTDERSLPYFSAGWGFKQHDRLLGPSWWVTVDLGAGLSAMLMLL